ncbi:MAG: cation:proton antiporter [Sulfurimonas sp.]|nr:cation:proton antiporter [Sulfurimonas sp.]
MEEALIVIVIALGISTLLNIFLKRIGVSEIIGYIFTGIILVYALDLRNVEHRVTLEHIGEFGIVFLMFTIGLEISLRRMNSMKAEIFGNGFLQSTITAGVIMLICHYGFNLDFVSSLIISTAFALSSTAIVLSYLKSSKEIYKPYGQRATGILIFQDIAVIPLLILIGFLASSDNESIWVILQDTAISAIIVVGLLFVVGRRVVSWLLHFSAASDVDELFMSSVLFIVIGASVLASYFGFTYSLGAFVIGMIIAETKYHHKVEYDIAPFKNILLGTFFVVVGMKIDISYFINNVGLIIGIFIFIFILKTLITYIVVRFSSPHATALKTALSISQVGEFSFVIFAVASSGNLLEKELESLLLLIVIFSMMVTPFFIAKISSFVDSFVKDDTIYPATLSFGGRKNHVVVCGYSIVGKFVTKYLDELDAPYVIIDNSPKHVKEAMSEDKEVYLGDMSKIQILEALNVKEASAVIVTLDNISKKRAICEAILKHTENINLIVKVISLEEKEALSDLDITVIVDGKLEIGKVLVEKTMSCQLNYN